MLNDVLEYLPQEIKLDFFNLLDRDKEMEDKIEEIRFRINRRPTLKIGQDFLTLKPIITKEIMTQTFENICEKSVYSYTKQISEGFITLKGGNRVGLTGTCVIENEKIININYISSLNFRIAKQIIDSSVPFLKYIIDIQNDTIFNTLIASSPGARKNNNYKRLSTKNI